MNLYHNQNRLIHRSNNPFEKVASIYDQQSISNRVEKKAALTFSELAPMDSEVIIRTIQKEAEELAGFEISKTAAIGKTSPFEVFGRAKHYIKSKFGLSDDLSHDLASSVVARAQDLQELYGGELEPMITGIVDHMSPEDVRARVGSVSTRQQSVEQVEEEIKQMLIDSMQLSAYKADQLKKTVVQHARNLATQYRTYTLSQLAKAIVNVIIDHQDISIVYGISSNNRLKEEIEYHLKQL